MKTVMLLILTSKKVKKPKTRKFLELLENNLIKNDVEFSTESFQDIEVLISNEDIKILVSGSNIDIWSTIFPRKVGSYSGLAFILASYAKNHGIFFIDQFRGITNDLTKLIQMFLFSSEKIPVPKTYYTAIYNKEHLSNAIRFLGFPVIIKQCNTSKGSGVALAKNKTDLTRKINAFVAENPSKEIILQEYIENTFEYRIFVTGNSVAIAEKKTRVDDKEFRNNVHLGATEEFLNPKDVKKSIIQTALKAAKTTNTQVAGVDITEDIHGNLFVFEVNSCPGFTLDERVSDEIKQLAEYLSLCEKK